MRRQAGRFVLGLLVVSLLAGCASGSSGSDEPKAEPSAAKSSLGPGVQLASPLSQGRLDATRHMIEAPLVNGGPAEIRIRRIQLIAPQFTEVPPTVFNDAVTVGQSFNFPIGYGAAQCDVDGKSAAEVVVETEPAAGGSAQTVRLTAPAPVEILGRLHHAECEQKKLEAAATVQWGSTWTRVPAQPGGAQRIRGELRIHLKPGSDPLTVTNIVGSVLYELDTAPPGKRPLARLDESELTATVPVEIGVRLCFKHGLTEAKKVFVFTLYAKLGSGKETYRTIEPPKSVQDQAAALLATCPPEGPER
jgi:hypothetical protein